MSNPGVLSLASLAPVGADFRFEIEDNIGEAIHIHYKDIRLDLSVDEFDKLAAQIPQMIDAVVDVNGFSCMEYDAVNLVGLAACLPDLVKITEDELYLEELLIDTYDENGKQILAPISQSRVFKAINGNSSENDVRKQVNFYNSDTAVLFENKDRVIYNLNRIKEHGYPENSERIILFNDSNQIFDGQHRAACLYYLRGNIKVPVRRLWFQNNKYTSVDDRKSVMKRISLKNEPNLKKIKVGAVPRGNIIFDLSSLKLDSDKQNIVIKEGL